MLVIFHFPKFHTMRGVPESHSIQRRKAWKRKLEKKGSPRGCWVHLVDLGFVLLLAYWLLWCVHVPACLFLHSCDFLCLPELRDRVSVGVPGFGISSVNMPEAYGSDGVVA